MKIQEISVEKLTSIIEEKDRKIAELERQVEWFLSQLRLSKHKQYGASSEQTDSNQMSIFNEAESTADLIQPEPEITEVKAHYRKRTRLTTDKLPEDLPIEVIEHELPDCTKIYDGLSTISSGAGMETERHFIIKTDHGQLALKGK